MWQTKKLRTVWLSAVVWAVACAMPASAALINLSSSFSEYNGPVAYPPGSPEDTGLGPSFLNGIEVAPSAPSSRPGVGLLNFTFAPGTSSIDFYTGSETHNLLQFTPGPAQDVLVGQEFLIGTFTLQNGNWFGGLGEGDALFSFSVTTSSSDPTHDGHVFSDVIRYSVTQFAAVNTPEENADSFSFFGRPDLGIMSVYEIGDSPTGSNIGTVDLYGRISSLIPTRFANAQGGVFIAAAAVPEPGICTLILAGLVMGFASHRRRK